MAELKPGWYVQVIAFDAEEGVVEKRLGPYASERTADRADRGVNINLNHDRFYTLVKREPPEEDK